MIVKFAFIKLHILENTVGIVSIFSYLLPVSLLLSMPHIRAHLRMWNIRANVCKKSHTFRINRGYETILCKKPHTFRINRGERDHFVLKTTYIGEKRTLCPISMGADT